MDNHKLLSDLYYKYKNFDSIESLYRKAKDLNKTVTRNQVKQFLQAQSVHQQTTVDKVIPSDPLPIYSEDHNAFQIDLTFLPKYKTKNDGYYVLFTAINTNSRYAYAYWAKDKETDSIVKMLEEFKNNTSEISTITCDSGSEFISVKAKAWFINNNIKMYYLVDDSNKLGIINRFHRTLKEKLNKMFIATGSVRWIDSIDEVIKNYNNTVNTTTGFTPKQASKGFIQTVIVNQMKEKTEAINEKNKDQLDDIVIGNKCRILNTSTIFDKMKVKYSDDVYTIIEVHTNSVDVENEKHILRHIKKSNIKIVDEVQNNVVSNERKEVEKEYKRERIHKKEDIKEDNIIRTKREIKKPEKLNL